MSHHKLYVDGIEWYPDGTVLKCEKSISSLPAASSSGELSRKEEAADNDAGTIGSYYAQTRPIITRHPPETTPRPPIISI